MSGQKNVKYSNKYNLGIKTAVCLLILLFAVDFLLIRHEKTHYLEKIDILTRMTESGGDLDVAADILKGKDEPRTEDTILKSYGYLAEDGNELQKEYQKRVRVLLAVSAGLYLLVLWVILSAEKRERLRREAVLEELRETLCCFREGEYGFSIKEHSPELEGILLELESMGGTLTLRQEESDREREGVKSLVTDISHQLKTPVAALKAAVEILEQDDLTEAEREEFLGRCRGQVRGLELLMSSLISISRMESGMIEIKPEEKVIFETIVDAVNRVYGKAEEKEIRISLEAEEELRELKISHDRKWLCEAFINLLENAVKYSPNGKSITIRMEERTHFLRIEFEDEGIGIPRSEYHKIFQRFYRGQSKAVKAQEGSGVGLYLTREIIRRHQGTITVHAKDRYSQKESGSIFVVQLPY